jgi:hypothetical protein
LHGWWLIRIRIKAIWQISLLAGEAKAEDIVSAATIVVVGGEAHFWAVLPMGGPPSATWTTHPFLIVQF